MSTENSADQWIEYLLAKYEKIDESANARNGIEIAIAILGLATVEDYLQRKRQEYNTGWHEKQRTTRPSEED